MNDCKVCGGTEFYKEAGYYFCIECQTQNQDKREEILELRLEGTRLTKRKIPKTVTDKIDHSFQWTTWEQYNFILIGLTDELIELGATPDLKLTVLQLWAYYLGQTEVAFTSKEHKKLPKLARGYHRKDAEILYGQLKSRRRKRRKITSNSSMVSSLYSEGSSVRELNKYKRLMVNEEYNRLAASQESDSDGQSLAHQSLHSVCSAKSQSSVLGQSRLKYSKHAKKETLKVVKMSKKLPISQRLRYRLKHVTTKYRAGPNVITPMKLWAILYIALRIHNQDIHLADMLRYGREGHLSYFRLDHLLPAEMALSDNDVKLLSQYNEITHKGMRKTSGEIAKFLSVHEMACPDLVPLVNRYCKDLSLPKKVSIFAGNLIALSPPKMIFNKQEPAVPNYEGRAMALLLVVLKVLLGMDGITEYETSRVAENINRNQNYFSKSICEGGKLASAKSGNVCVIVHGGCGRCSDSVLCEKLDGCKKAASIGYKKIIDGGNSIDAVQAALWWFECDELFNCGYGSVLNQSGEVQMDASIMDGSKLEIGSVAAISDIEHPINLAKFVLENYPNTIIVGDGATKLSRCTKANIISKGNMVSPEAALALNLSKNCNPAIECDAKYLEGVDLPQKSWGSTGCVAWDGNSIAAGTTTGGLSGKMVGRIGDSALLGCGTFANDIAGCSLSGHGETIAKLGLSRDIVMDIAKGSCPEDALKLHLDYMYEKSDREAGGIVLGSNGCWGIYFTTSRMPFAVVKKNIITSGADLYDKKIENYFDPDEKLEIGAADIGEPKLFSFREWQRYIECRKNILTSRHFPTKFKNDWEGFGGTELYVNFIKSALSRREESPETTNYKNSIPRDLTNAMEKCIDMIKVDSTNSDCVEIFPPSLTPQYSYLEKLIEHPTHDIPDLLRNDFRDAKMYHLIKPKRFIKSAAKSGIKLGIVNSGLHFFDKFVPRCEKQKMPSLKEWDESVRVVNRGINISEDLSEYLDQKGSHRFRLSAVNQSHYDAIQKRLMIHRKNETPRDAGGELEDPHKKDFNFGFDDVTAVGKLAISHSNDLDIDDNSVFDISEENDRKDENEIMNFYQKYYLKLPDSCITNESESQSEINSKSLLTSNRKTTMLRTRSGKFLRKSFEKAGVESESHEAQRSIFEVDHISWDENEGVKENGIDSARSDVSDDSDKLFIPSENYWMYHCIFSKVKPKNFEYLLSELPVSFNWLLNECADVVEMSKEDLYEQVCLVETHFAYVIQNEYKKLNSDDAELNQAKIRHCKKKW